MRWRCRECGVTASGDAVTQLARGARQAAGLFTAEFQRQRLALVDEVDALKVLTRFRELGRVSIDMAHDMMMRHPDDGSKARRW